MIKINEKGVRLLVELEVMGIKGYDMEEELKNELTDKVLEVIGVDFDTPNEVINAVGELEQEIKNGFTEPLETTESGAQREYILELAHKQLAYKIFEKNMGTYEDIMLYGELDKLRNIGKLHTFKGY